MLAQANIDITDGENILVKAGELFTVLSSTPFEFDLYQAISSDGSTLFAVSQREMYFKKAAWQSCTTN